MVNLSFFSFPDASAKDKDGSSVTARKRVNLEPPEFIFDGKEFVPGTMGYKLFHFPSSQMCKTKKANTYISFHFISLYVCHTQTDRHRQMDRQTDTHTHTHTHTHTRARARAHPPQPSPMCTDQEQEKQQKNKTSLFSLFCIHNIIHYTQSCGPLSTAMCTSLSTCHMYTTEQCTQRYCLFPA